MFKTLQQFLKPNDKVLLAVSGGADSRVLLDLMEKNGAVFGVAHIDHQLRQESTMEAAFLEEYCRLKKIPFYLKCWEEKPASGLEAKAREFRYAFFAEIMARFGYNKLMTAHHADDQAETLMMRLIRGGSFASHQGIKTRQIFGSGELIRPLLSFSKSELLDYAEDQQLTYFEDASNQDLSYTRNRIRHQIIPVMKLENPQVLNQLSEFHQQLVWSQELMEELLEYEAVQSVEENFTFSIEFIQTKSTAYRYYWLTGFFKRYVPKLIINQRQLLEIMKRIGSGASQWSIDLGEDWCFKRSYDQLLLARKSLPILDENYLIEADHAFFLNDQEWIALIPSDRSFIEPSETADWKRYECCLDVEELPLTLRRRHPGDRIQLTKKLRKKISRWFIDEKIPKAQRERSWVLTNADQEILALLPFKNSCLSIDKETDKIHYRLLYKYYLP